MDTAILWEAYLEHNGLVTDLNQLKILAKQHRDKFEVLGYSLELHDDISDEAIDAWVNSIAQPIIDAIDCTQCANCCRSLDVYLTVNDAQRLAKGFHISLDDISLMIDHVSAQKVKEWGMFDAKPCQFLEGTVCSAYEHRPETCRTYPALTPNFRWLIDDMIEGASVCPIIYNVLVALHHNFEIGFLKRS